MRVREWTGRLLLVLAGTLAGLVLLEVTLRAGAMWMDTGRAAAPAWLTTRRRVLTLGDSNTYGVWVERTQAYPQVFETTWNLVHPAEPIEVVNGGYPGTNSSWVRNHLPALLSTLRPDLVLVMVGVNDFWTVPEPPTDTVRSRTWEQSLWQNSRAYRLLFILARTLRPQSLEVHEEAVGERETHATLRYGSTTFDAGWHALDAGDPRSGRGLLQNLMTLPTIARRAHVDFAFVTYPCQIGAYRHANELIRGVAAATGTRLIDPEPFFAACVDHPCASLFPDGHPTAHGHHVTGKIVARALGPVLIRRDGVAERARR